MQRLHVSQPSLSRQIRDLEDEMGVQLLERTAKSVRLTEAGRAFLDEARAILKQTDDAVGKVRAIAGKARDRAAHRRLAAGHRPDHARASSRVSKSDAERKGEDARLAGREKHRRSARWPLAACDHPSSAQSKRARGAPVRTIVDRAGLPGRFLRSSIREKTVGLLSRCGAGTVYWPHARGVSALPGIPRRDLRARE